MNEEEVWKDIPDYEGYYQASNLGRIRSLDREVADRSGVRIANGKVLKSEMLQNDYLRVGLNKDGKTMRFLVHRLVWMAFNGTIPDGMQVNHIDECKTNNKLENLNLMTPKENTNFGTRNQRVAKANTNHPSMSKPVVAFNEDEEIVFEFSSTQEAARNGFNSGDLAACCRGERKTHKGLIWRFKEDIEKT